MKLFALTTAAYLTLANAAPGIIEIPDDNYSAKVGSQCAWISAQSYGQLVTCQAGWVMTGICGSGGKADCENETVFFQIQCCESGGSETQKNCELDASWFGYDSQCEGNKLAYGGCGSGQFSDCNHTGDDYYNELFCCDNDSISYGDGPTITDYGTYGQQLYCPPGYAVTEFCGSGRGKDCNGSVTKISCQPYEILA